MSLIPHTFFPRSMFDMDTWLPSQSHHYNNMLPFQSSMMMPSMLDLFDPFDDLDRLMGRNLQWIDQPAGFLPSVESAMPTEPQRHRITIDCAGFKPESIKTELKEVNGRQQLRVWGLEEKVGATEEDFSRKEFKKNYLLPTNAQHEKLVSFMAPGGKFIVDVPLTPPAPSNTISSFLPQIVDLPEGQGKGVQLQLNIPEHVDPSKVQVSVKDRDLIVKVEDTSKTADSVSRVHIYNRTRLPENVDFSALKCTHQNNMLNISAPLRMPALNESSRQVPIEKINEKQFIQDTK